MTNIFLTPKMLALAAVVAFGAFGFSSLTAHASTTDKLLHCEASNMRQFVKCCDAVINTNGKPQWFVENNMNCQTAAACKRSNGPLYKTSYVAPTRCGLSVPTLQDQGGSDKGPTRNIRQNKG
jgi:hypothetical protein